MLVYDLGGDFMRGSVEWGSSGEASRSVFFTNRLHKPINKAITGLS